MTGMSGQMDFNCSASRSPVKEGMERSVMTRSNASGAFLTASSGFRPQVMPVTRQPKAHALSGWLGGEERVENLLQVFFCDSFSVVGDAQHDSLGFLSRSVCRSHVANRHPNAPLDVVHGMGGVDAQVRQYLVDLGGIGQDFDSGFQLLLDGRPLVFPSRSARLSTGYSLRVKCSCDRNRAAGGSNR